MLCLNQTGFNGGQVLISLTDIREEEKTKEQSCWFVFEGRRRKQIHLRYLDLFVVAHGSDGRGGVQRALGAAGAELHHRLGPTHEARHRAPILDQLLLLLLQEINKPSLQPDHESIIKYIKFKPNSCCL